MSPLGESGSFHLIRQERERTFVTFGLAGREGATKGNTQSVVNKSKVLVIDEYV